MAKFSSILLLCSLLVAANGVDIPGIAGDGIADLFGVYGELLAKGRCHSNNAAVAIATYINGAELIAKNMPSPVGSSFLVGPRLRYLEERTKFHWGNWCSSGKTTLPTYIPPRSIGIFSVGESKGAFAMPEVDLYFRVSNEQDVSTDCILKVYVNNDAASWGSVYTTPTIWMRKENPAVCDAAIPNLKIHDTGLWCKNFDPKGTWASKGGCAAVDGRIDYGNTFLVYFDPPTSKPASIGDVNGDVPSNTTRGVVWADDKSADAVAEAPGAEVPADNATDTPSPSSSSGNDVAAPAASSSNQRIPSLVLAFISLAFSGLVFLV